MFSSLNELLVKNRFKILITTAKKNVQGSVNIFRRIAKETKPTVPNSKYANPNTKFAIGNTKYIICKFTLVFLEK